MEHEPRTIGVNGIKCGTIPATTPHGVETCFVLRVHGQPGEVIQLAGQSANLPEFLKSQVEIARNEFPDAMRDVPPL